MSDEVLGDRRRALEEEFFKAENERLRAKLHAGRERSVTIAELAAASGISDEAVLKTLIDHEVDAETLAAFSLAPLIAVAWADGKLDAKERDAIVRAAEDSGVEVGSAAHELLEAWLAKRPGAKLLASWESYTQSLCASLDSAGRAALKDEVLGRARRVADAAGGLLGLTSRISPEEKVVLDRLAKAFG